MSIKNIWQKNKDGTIFKQEKLQNILVECCSGFQKNGKQLEGYLCCINAALKHCIDVRITECCMIFYESSQKWNIGENIFQACICREMLRTN